MNWGSMELHVSPTGGVEPISQSRLSTRRTDRRDTPTGPYADVCEGDACHHGATGSRSAADLNGQFGRRFSVPAINHIVYTDDEWRIPLESGSFDVQQLQIQPTEPDPIACQTNLREVIVSASLEDQQWSTGCPPLRTGAARSHTTTRSTSARSTMVATQHRGGLADRRPVPLSALRRGQDRERHRGERRPQPHPIARFRPASDASAQAHIPQR